MHLGFYISGHTVIQILIIETAAKDDFITVKSCLGRPIRRECFIILIQNWAHSEFRERLVQ